MSAKKFYAIAIGRKPGIYTEWPIAQAQVTGYPGAIYKGFPTKEDALAWLKNPSHPTTTKPPRDFRMSSSQNFPAKPDEVTIYTDGGARNNPGPGGYGIVQLFQGERKELSGGYRLTTNNRMELMGCIVALRELEFRSSPIILHTDSSYVVNGINKGWAKSWRRNGWIKSDRQPAINRDLWALLLELIEGLDISFRWVKGHAGHPLNERCDALAVAAAKGEKLPVDPGYPG